jgi:hypothetical protein
MHSGGRKLHQLMVIADCPLRSLANGGLYVRDEGDCRLSAPVSLSRQADQGGKRKVRYLLKNMIKLSLFSFLRNRPSNNQSRIIET